jgi:hypothetical protein
MSCSALAAGSPACRNNIAALDTEFQAAVKRNDVAAVDRFLPDDYILVSSTGEVQTKADLVNDARAKTYIYQDAQKAPAFRPKLDSAAVRRLDADAAARFGDLGEFTNEETETVGGCSRGQICRVALRFTSVGFEGVRRS